VTASTLTELTRMALPSLPALRPQCMQIVGTGRRHVRGDGGRMAMARGGDGEGVYGGEEGVCMADWMGMWYDGEQGQGLVCAGLGLGFRV